jgi:signal transduction histidine kinase
MPQTGSGKTIKPTRARAASAARAEPETVRFQSLVPELATAMARAPAHSVDREIETWLGRICKALDLDRSAIYERDTPADRVHTTHTWVRANIPPFPRNYDPEELVKSTTDWVMAGNRLTFSHPGDIPPELEDLRRAVKRYGPAASAVIPMWAGERVIGAASFGRFRSPREWSPELLDRLTFTVRLFGSAIERKQSEAMLHTANAEIRLASRRNMMSELVGSLAHELNQPLTAIMSNLGGLKRLLLQGNSDPAAISSAADDAIEDTKRAAEIVRRVRAMFKNHDRKETIDIRTLIAEVVKLIASEAAFRRVTVRTEVSPAAQRVVGDAIHLQQCVVNLLLNAFDAIAEAKDGPREVAIRVAPEKTRWVGIKVSDTGAGIDPSVANRLFEPFVTTKSNGMGLGLLVTRSIVENHGGKIWAAPNPTRGTTFAFTLPLAQKDRASASKRA